MGTPTHVAMVDGFWDKVPNHQVKRLYQQSPKLVGLYMYFYDAVIVAKGDTPETVETPVYTYCCPEHGKFESVEQGESLPCRHEYDDGILEGNCNQDSPYQSMRVEGAVFWGTKLSLLTIANQMGIAWQKVQRDVGELEELGYIRRTRESVRDEYRYWVTDCYKYNEPRLEAMRSQEKELVKRIARERRRKKDRKPELCIDCGESIPYEFIAKHTCMEKQERVKAEINAAASKEVLDFYSWIGKEPKAKDNELMQGLIDAYGWKKVMLVLDHCTHKGYWSVNADTPENLDRNKVGINNLKFVVDRWDKFEETYNREVAKESKENKKKAAIAKNKPSISANVQKTTPSSVVQVRQKERDAALQTDYDYGFGCDDDPPEHGDGLTSVGFEFEPEEFANPVAHPATMIAADTAVQVDLPKSVTFEEAAVVKMFSNYYCDNNRMIDKDTLKDRETYWVGVFREHYLALNSNNSPATLEQLIDRAKANKDLTNTIRL
jgi:DNA-binding Lrp family transcriptional regulator